MVVIKGLELYVWANLIQFILKKRGSMAKMEIEGENFKDEFSFELKGTPYEVIEKLFENILGISREQITEKTGIDFVQMALIKFMQLVDSIPRERIEAMREDVRLGMVSFFVEQAFKFEGKCGCGKDIDHEEIGEQHGDGMENLNYSNLKH